MVNQVWNTEHGTRNTEHEKNTDSFGSCGGGTRSTAARCVWCGTQEHEARNTRTHVRGRVRFVFSAIFRYLCVLLFISGRGRNRRGLRWASFRASPRPGTRARNRKDESQKPNRAPTHSYITLIRCASAPPEKSTNVGRTNETTAAFPVARATLTRSATHPSHEAQASPASHYTVA
jgi:hypothetical protein